MINSIFTDSDNIDSDIIDYQPTSILIFGDLGRNPSIDLLSKLRKQIMMSILCGHY